MHLPFEILVVIGIVGFYIYDSAYLYFYNEFNLTKGLFKHFNAQPSSKKLNFLHRYLVLPNLFLPHHLTFKCTWNVKKLELLMHVDDIHFINTISKILKPLQFVNILLFMLTLFCLPVIFWFQGGYTLLAIAIILIYLINIMTFITISIQRKALKLSWSKLFQFLLDVLLCPPFSLNILRKISLNYKVQTDGLLIAKSMLPPEDYQTFLDNILKEIHVLKMASSEEDLVLLEFKEQQIHAFKNIESNEKE